MGGARTAAAQTTTTTVSTGALADWALFGFDGSAWEEAVAGRAYLTYRLELTDRPPPPPPDAGFPDSGFVDSGVVPDAGFPDSGVTPDAGFVDAGTPDSGTGGGGLPPYSGGTCPTFRFASNNSSSGDNTFTSAGITRRVRLIRSGSAPNPALIFTFHARSSQPGWGIDDLGLAGGNGGNYVIVAPDVVGNGNFVSGREQWMFDVPAATNSDLVLFDDLHTCLSQQLGANLDRVSVSGFSAGGLFASYLLMHRSEHLSAAAIFSGGLYDSTLYEVPFATPPAMIVWGGPNDAYYQWGQIVDPLYESSPYTHSFDLAALDFAARLEQNAQFVVRCDHGGGHTPGPISYDASRGGYLWPQNWPFRWLYDHVRGAPSPFAAGFPAGTMPSACQ
jgi:hypothetical protein